jgi:para-nitrobenzyl esterase
MNENRNELNGTTETTEIERPIVETESGGIRGTVEGGVAAFRGVPFAASPVGELRFAAPVAHPKWPDLRDADRPGPAVPQSPSRLEAVMGPRTPDWDEDGSLNLNVWTPAPAGRRISPARPAGAGLVPRRRVQQRLRRLGLVRRGEAGRRRRDHRRHRELPHRPARLPLPAGARRREPRRAGPGRRPRLGGPQHRGLRRRPRQHHGRRAVGRRLLLAVPSPRPTTGPQISRVITQSGPFGLDPQSPEEASEHARRFLAILGIDGSLDPLAALRAVPAERLLSAYQQLAGELARPGNVAPPMYPVLGGSGMPAAWQQAVAEGRLDGKQLLSGTTRNEMTSFLAFDPRIRTITADQAREIVAGQIDGGAERFDRTAARLENANPSEVLTEVETELVFRDGTLVIADHQAASGNATYVYEFDYTPPNDPAHLGSAHCAELPFFFNTLDTYPDSPMLGEPTPAARALGDTFSRAAATFVATGRPAAGDWQPYESANPATVRHFA